MMAFGGEFHQVYGNKKFTFMYIGQQTLGFVSMNADAALLLSENHKVIPCSFFLESTDQNITSIFLNFEAALSIVGWSAQLLVEVTLVCF